MATTRGRSGAELHIRCGVDAEEVAGHDLDALSAALERRPGAPQALVARTTFGKGVDFMESRIEWHYLPMNEEQYASASAQVGSAGAR